MKLFNKQQTENEGLPQNQAQGQMPQTQQPKTDELEIRARNEMAMFEHTAKKKQMQAKMKPKIKEIIAVKI